MSSCIGAQHGRKMAFMLIVNITSSKFDRKLLFRSRHTYVFKIKNMCDIIKHCRKKVLEYVSILVLLFYICNSKHCQSYIHREEVSLKTLILEVSSNLVSLNKVYGSNKKVNIKIHS